MSRSQPTGAVTIDLNADLGESFGRWTLGDDDALLPLVTSANVACGFHAGDPTILRRTCVNAVAAGVTVGAQVSYRDLAGFGRRFIDVSPTDLAADVLYQLGALDGLARAAGTRVKYLKPHGALYHATITHGAQAAAVLDALESYDDTLAVLGMPGSLLLAEADRRGVRTVAEAFADRAYRADGTLVSRGTDGAVLHDADAIAARVVRLVTEHRLTAVDGTELAVEADSVCLHGDTPGAVAIARAVREALAAAGVDVVAFA